ncbi:GH92 family glycosyl hydrolase [Fodinicola acaciae]|uniref:GH92 family glycosyl hydrolase n=1 Tax=Fodinicola acaciae TaxID=2681555 RepID=UPI0013D87344|nr:GH92 family glycosyl hydrolase [Fodinicola acaciae]
MLFLSHIGRSTRRKLCLAASFSLSLAASLMLTAAPAAATPARAGATAVNDPAQYVNTFVGTKPGATDFGNGGGAGNTFPGADAPFGMLQWSPDTVTYQHGGYFYDDNRIRGFSLTHISGAGCGDYGNIPFMPIIGRNLVSSYTFSHANESAAPGSYSVTFDNGLRTELAVSKRAGIARFSYPGTDTASLLIDVAKAFNNAMGAFTVGTNTITGYEDGGGFCGAGNRYRVYFTATFDHTIMGYDTPTATQPILHFDTSTGRTVTARVGISFVSIANAQQNLSSEQGNRTFEQVRDGTRADWNAQLTRISVSGGTAAQATILYTALYHSLLFPQTFSDVNGQYVGFDKTVHTAAAGHTQYATFSGWDVYRSQTQLVAFLDPATASDIGQSITDQAAQAGYLDRWTLANGGTGVMNGDPLPTIAASMYAFGGTGFNATDLLNRAVAGTSNGNQRPGYAPYNTKGYVPTGTGGVWGSAATSLEYYSSDFAISQLAQRLGNTSVAKTYLQRAQGWRNLMHDGYIQPRDNDGGWPSFNPSSGSEYTEGNGAQYTWMVPFNYQGLFAGMGGNGSVVPRLDGFFAELNAGPDKANAYLGNEPSAETPWAYAYAGAPYRTQDVVRRAVTTLYKPTQDGEVGNDDLGQLSSWAVWASIGMYPEAPGRSELVLASPLFSQITINRGNGATITINAPNASDSIKYVQALTVNGQASTKPWLSESFVAAGGSLNFTLGSSPNTAWGSAAADAPPSFDYVVSNGATGAIVGLGSKCVDVSNSGTANGTAVQLWTCNNSDAQKWTLRSDQSIGALGKCLDIANSGTGNGTLIQLWDCNRTNAQIWQQQADGSLRNPNSGRCLDVPNSNTTDGTRLQIYDCNGTGAQRWTLPSGA